MSTDDTLAGLIERWRKLGQWYEDKHCEPKQDVCIEITVQEACAEEAQAVYERLDALRKAWERASNMKGGDFSPMYSLALEKCAGQIGAILGQLADGQGNGGGADEKIRRE